MENTMLNILIIDDDLVYRRLSSSILQERFNVFTAEAPSVGFNILKTKKIDYVICDYRLPEMDGLEVLERIKTDYPHIELIMISDSGDMNTVIEALRRGAVDYFKKPFTPADVWMSIERTQKYAQLNKKYNVEKTKNTHLKEIVDREFGVEIIGSSNEITEVLSQMRMVAQTPDTSVLILGESGTGKELVARGIHNLSSRNNEIFGAVNMSAIPENLFESEFFGHKKGSFTGAIADKAGWFENTNKGTLFLDEIGEMTPALQVKLLRVLEDRTFTKIGTQNQQKFDIRIVAATNKPIEDISNGINFRVDLFHRVGTFIIYLPPLRERKGDIVLLANHFLKYFSLKMNKNISTFHNESIKLLREYNFPGNIRELKNIMERAVILCTGNELLPANLLMLNSKFNKNNQSEINTFDLEVIEKSTIMRALNKTNNNKSEAAKLLNIEWNSLHRRMQKYGIEL
ncbi:MAG: sigma-54 dependent transcriptional regulator [Paludibacter sp.]